MTTMMDASWFQFHRKLRNIGKNILKLTSKDATLERFTNILGHDQVKKVGDMTKSLKQTL
jgi:hypothetical protein